MALVPKDNNIQIHVNTQSSMTNDNQEPPFSADKMASTFQSRSRAVAVPTLTIKPSVGCKSNNKTANESASSLVAANNLDQIKAEIPEQTSESQQAKQAKIKSSPKSTSCCQDAASGSWAVKASQSAMLTRNPIREIIETMNLAENPAKKVIPLSIGDPTIFGNLKPCKEILEALDKANSSGKYYGYQTAAGMESSRDAVAEYHSRCTGVKVRRQDVILASGCSHAIDLSICVLADRGQNILIPRPGFPLYKTLTSVYGVHYKQYNLLAEENWAIDFEHLESLIDHKTAAIIVNNPSNPCGSVFSQLQLKRVLRLAQKHRLPIIADEIYDKFVFSSVAQMKSRKKNQLDDEAAEQDTKAADENQPPVGTEIQEQGQEKTPDRGPEEPTFFKALSSIGSEVPILTCGGISKTCLIPGLRLGWIIINDPMGHFHPSVRDGLNRLTQRLMGPNSLVQGALPDILAKVPSDFYAKTMDFIYLNAKLCFDRLALIDGLHPHMPQGSMYFMVKFEPNKFPNIKGDLDFTSKLMNEESVLVLPGRCFDFPNYFRICLTVPTKVMDEALERIRDFCDRHRP